ncbi:MAG: single-stranded DNA-binding protein [Clostridia bacterium]|nr:single-stranded DNA-binding protein [Clostridia bacterium]
MANFNFNKVILGGRLTADPELRQTPQGISVTSFSIAVNRPYSKNAEQQQADFINCVAWRSNADFITRYFRKGSSICVTGSLQTRTWTDQQGQKRYATDVVVSEATFVDSRNESGFTSAAPVADSYSAPAYSSTEEEAPKFEELSSDDDLPF